MDVVTRLSGKSSRARGSEQRCPTDERLLDANVGAPLSGVGPCRISLLFARRPLSVGEGPTVDMEAKFFSRKLGYCVKERHKDF